MRVVFMGSPAFAVPSLEALAERYAVVGIITQPDRAAGRGRRLRSPEVKRYAQAHSMPILQPLRLREPEVIHQIESWASDVIVVAAFGQLIPPAILDLPEHGCVNVHPSLLPRWRGASPVQAAILHGDEESGVTIMKLDAGLDTGPTLSQRKVRVLPGETAGDLAGRLAKFGADLLIETLPAYLQGSLTPKPQDEALATHSPQIPKSAGEMDFTKTAEELARQVRAYEPWPASFLPWKGRRLVVHRARASNADANAPGQVQAVDGYPAVMTSAGLLILEIVQPEGKRPMDGADFIRGAPDFVGSLVTVPGKP